MFGGDAAFDAVIAGLPLGEGYKTTLRTFEVGMQQRVRLWSLAVTGAPSISVPAGTYETWRVEVEPLDGEGGPMTVWVSQDPPRTLVKAASELPAAMGGGTVETVLAAEGSGETGEAAAEE